MSGWAEPSSCAGCRAAPDVADESVVEVELRLLEHLTLLLGGTADDELDRPASAANWRISARPASSSSVVRCWANSVTR